jgi:hypothetical protein
VPVAHGISTSKSIEHVLMPSMLSGPFVVIVACPPQTVPVLTKVKISQVGRAEMGGMAGMGGITTTSGNSKEQAGVKETNGRGVS